MCNANYTSGKNYEYRFIEGLIETGNAVKAARFYHSEGPTDVWWVDKDGVHNEAQCKYSKHKAYISRLEFAALVEFAKSVSPQIRVWLVKKNAYKKTTMELIE